MCRARINKDEVIKKKMESPVQQSVENQNPFGGFAKVDDNVMDYDYNPPEGMPMVMAPNENQ